MKELFIPIQNLFNINLESVREYFFTLAGTIVFTYLIIVILRILLQKVFKHTSILEEKRKRQ